MQILSGQDGIDLLSSGVNFAEASMLTTEERRQYMFSYVCPDEFASCRN